MRIRRIWWQLAVVGSLATGCGKDAPPPPAPAAPAPPAAAQAAAPAPEQVAGPAANAPASPSSRAPVTLANRPGTTKPKRGAGGTGKSGALGAVSSAAADALKTMNPFRPPRLEQPVPKSTDKNEENKAVRLVGFVDVGELKAILAFDGKLQTLSVGDVYNDVAIVAVTPPTVRLRHGQREWDAGLFQQPIINTSGSNTAHSSATPQVTVGPTNEPVRSPGTFQSLFPSGSMKSSPFAAPGNPPTLSPAEPTLPSTMPLGAPPLPGSSDFIPRPVAPPAPPGLGKSR